MPITLPPDVHLFVGNTVRFDCVPDAPLDGPVTIVAIEGDATVAPSASDLSPRLTMGQTGGPVRGRLHADKRIGPDEAFLEEEFELNVEHPEATTFGVSPVVEP